MNVPRIPVYAICERTSHPPLALGSMITFAQQRNERRLEQAFHFVPRLFSTTRALHRAIRKHGDGLILFSSYIWNGDQNEAISRGIKRLHPRSVTIHGGPSVPKYPEAAARFFGEFEHVDIAARGEGEETFAEILECLRDGAFLRTGLPETLGKVAGITFRGRDGALARTEDRAPIADLSVLPSSYAGGFFESLPSTRWLAGVIETNRGCPYGCTYCDWGSATLQKLRQFPLEHVKREIEWMARNRFEILWMADANFGILERDVEIAEWIAEMKSRYGYPYQVVTNYAKNATERLGRIIGIFSAANLPSEGTLTVQTRDPETLKIIRRANIKTERYEELLEIFRKLRLPIATDLLIGLPGMTPRSFERDLQYFFEQEVHVQVYQIRLLPNSPMAHPDYMREFRIETDARGLVVSSSSFSSRDVDEMHVIYGSYTALVSHGVARYLLHWLQHDHGVPAMAALAQIRARAEAGPYPVLAKTLAHFRRTLDTRANVFKYSSAVLLTPWTRFYADLARLLKDAFGTPEDSALRTILEVQRALMPAAGRALPQTVQLEHDVTEYFAELRRARASGSTPRPLKSFAPGVLEVSDPLRMCRRPLELLLPYATNRIHFELASPLQTDTTRHRFMFVADEDTWKWGLQIPLAALRIARFVARGQLRRLDDHANRLLARAAAGRRALRTASGSRAS
jgi:radical SAM superfamily enzyme YgiQ (UPF0313 family)